MDLHEMFEYQKELEKNKTGHPALYVRQYFFGAVCAVCKIKECACDHKTFECEYDPYDRQ